MSSKLPLLDKMLNKMEEKIKDIYQSRQTLMKVNDFEEYKFNRSNIIQMFFDIENDIREIYQLVKSTLIQNKDLIEQIEYSEEKQKKLEFKLTSQEEAMNDLKLNFINISKELQYYEEKEAKDMEYIRELEYNNRKITR